MQIHERLKSRDLLGACIKDIFRMYDDETVIKVLEVQPELKNIDFVNELKKHPYKESIQKEIDRRKALEKKMKGQRIENSLDPENVYDPDNYDGIPF